MIYIVTRHDHAHTIDHIAEHLAKHRLADIRMLTYGALFARRKAPVGHYVFTDFDRLTSYEVEVAAAIARSIEDAAPGARILNRPERVLERYPLLRRLAALGLNDFTAWRLDGGDLPSRYPVFVRSEDDCKQPDTGLLHSEQALLRALESLRASGVPLKRRIAVEYCAEPGADGYFRKYGVLRIGEHVFPQNLQHNADWYVKRATHERQDDGPLRAESNAFVAENPHAEEVRRRFAIANIDFGRIDYGFVGGRMQVYEINTNPTIPPFWAETPNEGQRQRRARQQKRFLAALADIDTPLTGPKLVRFSLPRPRLQSFQPPQPRVTPDREGPPAAASA